MIHAVKLGGIADVGKALFDEHPLPKYQPQHPGQQTPGRLDKLNPFGTDKGVQPGYTPGRLGRALGATPTGPHSVIAQPTPGYGTGAVNRLKTVGHQLGEIGREAVFGSPMAVNRELRAPSLGGVAKNYLRSVRNFYTPRDPLGLMLGLGLPAASLYQAVNGDPNQRGANIGATLGGIATAPLTARLGIPGTLIQKPVQDLGAWIGGKFDPKTAGLVGRVAEAAKQNPATAALFAGAAVEGVRYLASKKNTTLPTRSS